ncbi:MAG: NYN domain-containing protein [Verrucomicrobia bacterium]|nr:NYN domain-containing protein [Verrucomicrobiota bacterium]MBU4366086.1 NYN domain-containing protein [Verrucomicrobiota bacterium]
MSFLSQLFGKRAGGRKTLTRPAEERVYVVDATGMVDPRQRNGGGQASPRDHFAILRMLAQFAGREGIEIQAVFTGRPLREAGEGQEFKGVRVFYTENGASAQAKMKDLIRKLAVRKDVVLLTANATLEREAGELGAVCMRLSTLRKSFDERDDRDRDRGDQGNRGEHGDRDRGNRERGNRNHGNRDRGNRDRGDRDRQHGPNNNRNPASETPEEPAEEADKREKENQTVLDLIDPV